MRAMVLHKQGTPLELEDVPQPKPSSSEVLVDVNVCGLCRTDLHVVDGDLKEPKLPLILGHQVVGRVAEIGANVSGFSVGDRVGVPWLGGSCGHCEFCLGGRENLCDEPVFTGYQKDGGFADRMTADARFCFPLPDGYSDLQVAPLLCAGLIGYRSYRMAGIGKRLGFYGFGAAAHILIQVAQYQQREVYAFSRPGDDAAQDFARSLGAVWAGGSDEPAPVALDGAIIFAPAGELVVTALRAVKKGAPVVCAGIHMSDIPSFPYSDLWGERVIRSVANLTRTDGEEFIELAPRIPVTTETHPYPLERANDALEDLREGRFTGAAVITINDSDD